MPDLHDFVRITSLSPYFKDLNKNPEDFIKVCRRRNNSKRQFLFVNTMQAKHCPTDPRDFMLLCKTLSKTVLDSLDKTNARKILCIGFAETATALAQQVFDNLYAETSHMAGYTQTTRETIPDADNPVYFTEDHSHAVSQKLYIGNILETQGIDHVLFIDDEITTGNTLIHLADQLLKINPGLQFTAASVCNWQEQNHIDKFWEKNIYPVAIIKGTIKEDAPIPGTQRTVPDRYGSDADHTLGERPTGWNGIYEPDPRLPIPCHAWVNYGGYLKRIAHDADWLPNDTQLEDHKGLAVGVGECMMPAIRFADGHPGYRTQSFTRSPIEACMDDGYQIRSAHQFLDPFGENYDLYLYDIPKDTRWLAVFADKMTVRFQDQIMQLAQQKGIPHVSIHIC